MRRHILPSLLISLSMFSAAIPAQASPAQSVPAAGLQFVNGAKQISCAFGFAAQRNGVEGFITAGHCGQAGDPVYFETPYGVQEVGEFTWSVGGDDPEALTDIAFIQIYQPSLRKGTLGDRPIEISRGISNQELIGAHPDLCKEGPKTKSTCGEIDTSLALTPHKVSVEQMYSAKGDSGAPMVARLRDGSVAAVAILKGSPNNDDYTTVGYPVTTENLSSHGITLQFF